MSHEKFKDMPKDDDEVKVLFEQNTFLKDIPVVMEYWRLDNIYANSVIFHESDVENLSQDEIVAFAFDNMKYEDRKHTFKRSGQFVFINFNFKVEE